MYERLQMGVGMTIGFTEHLQIVTANNNKEKHTTFN
jgi:hypothetical protein